MYSNSYIKGEFQSPLALALGPTTSFWVSFPVDSTVYPMSGSEVLVRGAERLGWLEQKLAVLLSPSSCLQLGAKEENRVSVTDLVFGSLKTLLSCHGCPPQSVSSHWPRQSRPATLGPQRTEWPPALTVSGAEELHSIAAAVA